jgi:esterase/lipase superfamily enzyme
MSTEAKRVERLTSRFLGQSVLCARWGSFGQPVLLFPTAGGDAEECERFKMMLVLRPLIEAGRIKVYSCDSVGGQALTERRSHPPGYFPRVQCLFDAFVRHEFVPWIRADCASPDIEIVTAGASIGAFNAVAAVCKHPDVFSKAIAMSGTYNIAKWLEPEDLGMDWYYSSPLHFVPNLQEGPQLHALRQRFVLLPTGEGPYEDPSESWRMGQVLGARGIPNRVDFWGQDYRHDWTTWREMLPRYLADT